LVHAPPDVFVEVSELALVPSEGPHRSYSLGSSKHLVLLDGILDLSCLKENLVNDASDSNLGDLGCVLSIDVGIDEVIRCISSNIKYCNPI
jgi:hypothetical protein